LRLSSLFISYSHKDEQLKKRLCVSLAPLLNQGLMDAWHDRQITPGDEFDKEISDELKKADVILLLVSPDYLSSRYIIEKEVPAAMRQREKGQARVVPVILRHSIQLY
jgi:TIR domain